LLVIIYNYNYNYKIIKSLSIIHNILYYDMFVIQNPMSLKLTKM